MSLAIGIDLGTTHSCVSFVDDDGTPKVIPTAEGDLTTPSVIWFDGRSADVGKRANLRKLVPPAMYIHEFVKRNMGHPIEAPPDLFDREEGAIPTPAPYEVGGYRYGASGMSAIILRKLKRDAIRHFKRSRKLPQDLDERQVELDAVITVPAYFGDKERLDTKLAGFAAGLNVTGIINEPTAAALAYGLLEEAERRIMVFDLGGGTFDVTILEMRNGDAQVLSSCGNNSLGGRDWDRIIEEHIYDSIQRRRGRLLDERAVFDVQQKALSAKHELSESEETTIFIDVDGCEVDIPLRRRRPADESDPLELRLGEDCFDFEERSSDLLNRCRALCEAVIARARVASPLGPRAMAWQDLDEIILVGGSSRMPMVRAMLDQLAPRRVRSDIHGFSYDTAISLGAALYGRHRHRVKDVTSHTIGVKVVRESDRYSIDRLIDKDTPLPATAERSYRAGAHAILFLYEGESSVPEECILRGRLELDNDEGSVTISVQQDVDGVLHVVADYPPRGRKTLDIKNALYLFGERATTLRDKIQNITLTG